MVGERDSCGAGSAARGVGRVGPVRARVARGEGRPLLRVARDREGALRHAVAALVAAS